MLIRKWIRNDLRNIFREEKKVSTSNCSTVFEASSSSSTIIVLNENTWAYLVDYLRDMYFRFPFPFQHYGGQMFHFPRYRLLFSNDKLCDRANHRCNVATRCLDSDKGRTLEHRRGVEKEAENRRTKLKLSMPIMIRAIASHLSKARPRETIYAWGCRLFMWFAWKVIVAFRVACSVVCSCMAEFDRFRRLHGTARRNR